MKQTKKEKDRFPKFRERFRELQGTRTNTEFADFLGMSRQTVGFYCNGDRVPDAIGVRDIAKKCDVSADWLLGLSDERAINGDMAQAARYTGFPASSISKLHELAESSWANSKALLRVIDQILRDRPDDFITWAWRAAMAGCCPKVSIEEAEFTKIRHSADIRLVEAANAGVAGGSDSVEVPIADYEDICTSIALEIIHESARDSLKIFKEDFKKAFQLEKAKE